MLRELDQWQERRGYSDRQMADHIRVSLSTIEAARRGRRAAIRRLGMQIGRYVPELSKLALHLIVGPSEEVPVA